MTPADAVVLRHWKRMQTTIPRTATNQPQTRNASQPKICTLGLVSPPKTATPASSKARSLAERTTASRIAKAGLPWIEAIAMQASSNSGICAR